MTAIYEVWEVVDPAGGSQIALLEKGQFESRRHMYDAQSGVADLVRSRNL